MKYISINILNNVIKNNIDKIPNDVDLIVANPRSGLLPASIISLIKNLPICDIDSFVDNRIFSSGSTKKTNFINDINDARKILIVEDSSYSGNSIRLIKNKIPESLRNKCILLVLFVNDNTKDLCDIYFNVINESRIFEWNLFHHRYINYAGIDYDLLFRNNCLKIKPTQRIEAVIINDGINKKEVEEELSKYDVGYNRVIYKKEIDSNVKFIVTTDTSKYKEYDIDIVNYNE